MGVGTVGEAKALVIDLLRADIAGSAAPVVLDPESPDPRDPGKFVLDGRVARAIHYFSGWNVKIDLDWFLGGYDEPVLHGTPFYWYVFAIPGGPTSNRDHYFICDFIQLRSWVLDFLPRGRDHRDHDTWRCDLRPYPQHGERQGCFRWGDEPIADVGPPSRAIWLDNVATVRELALIKKRVGIHGPGGESAAHRLLKLYVVEHKTDFGLSVDAQPFVEHSFQTGDRVDVMFENHEPDRTVVEVEVEGEREICIGIHQAIKYRSLAEAQAGYLLQSTRVRSLVVAYDTNYPRATELGERYDIGLQSVDRELVLATAG